MSRFISPNALGSLYMTLGSLGYVVNDGLVRKTTENGPGVYQALCLRSIGLAAAFAVMSLLRGQRTTRSHLERPVLLRVAAEVIGGALFFAAIVKIEFANAQAVLQIVPFAVALAASVVLREQVSRRQYLAILTGFAGVLIIIRPATDGFSAWSLLVLVSAIFIVLRELATRQVSTEIPATSIAFLTAVGFGVLTGVLSLFAGWRHVSGQSAMLLVLACCSLVGGYLFSIQTVRVGDLSVTAPFRYTGLLGAVVVGILLFGEVPDSLTILGSVVIVISGFYSVHLDRKRRGLRSVARGSPPAATSL